jgi:glutamyl-tRNA(Gln) amidotransferase subunit D
MEEIRPGDYVEVEFDGEKLTGRVMPRTELDAEGVVTLKLANGYNIGLSVRKTTFRVLKRMPIVPPAAEEKETGSTSGEFVSLISTGGTIASRIEYETGAVRPALNADELAAFVPELSQIAPVRTRVLMSILSEDMTPSHWSMIARAVYDEIQLGARGVVVAHGTDTMGYTAAALSFALRGLQVPVVLVGAQRSSDRPSTDAIHNLLNAVRFAKQGPAGVYVCMHASTDDPFSSVHLGVKVRKMHTSARYAFRSINSKPVAVVTPATSQLPSNAVPGTRSTLMEKFSDRAALVYSYPGISPGYFQSLVGAGYQGFVVAGTGLGHLPSYTVDTIRRLSSDGTLFFMTSQCLNGRVNMNVYTTGRRLMSSGVVPLRDMLPETAYVKLAWCLANFQKSEVVHMMLENIAGEFSPRTRFERWSE